MTAAGEKIERRQRECVCGEGGLLLLNSRSDLKYTAVDIEQQLHGNGTGCTLLVRVLWKHRRQESKRAE